MGELQLATHIEVDAEVRYWEDAVVNGDVDVDGSLIPGGNGGLWRARISLEAGHVEDWPQGTTASIHYKVCDAGLYWLTDAAGARLAQWCGHYVPNAFLCHGDDGHGDYIIMTVEPDGQIRNYRVPEVDPEQWRVTALQARGEKTP